MGMADHYIGSLWEFEYETNIAEKMLAIESVNTLWKGSSALVKLKVCHIEDTGI